MPMDSQASRPQEQKLPAPTVNLGSLQAFLEEIIRLGGFALKVEIRKAPLESQEPEGPEWIVDFSGKDADLLLEARAELLEAFAYVATQGARLKEDLRRKVVFDCDDYRATRAAELQLTAQLAAERAIETRKPFALTPMNAVERRSVHLALKDRPDIRTESQGTGPERHVVILPNQ